jgi:hypothetical protein
MTRDTRYSFADAQGARITGWRSYHGVPFGDISTALPNWHWPPLDDRVRLAAGIFPLPRLRAWLSDLAHFQAPTTLRGIARFVDDLGSTLDPELALRLFLETLLAEAAGLPNAAAVHILRD